MKVHRVVEQAADVDNLVAHDAIEKETSGALASTRDVKRPGVWVKFRPMSGRRAIRISGDV